MRKLNYLFLMLFLATIISCEDDSDAVLDNENPTITIVSPTSQMELYPDEQVMVEATVRDNLGLEEVTVSVTPPGGTAQVVLTESVSDFLNDNKEAEIEEAISLGTATPAAGSYLITVTATDERGNKDSKSVTINVLEDDQVMPAIAVTSPEANSVFMLGDQMELNATVTENKVLQEIRVTVGADGANPIYTNTITEGFDSELEHAIAETITIPETAAVGSYTLTIEADDRKGNTGTSTTNFTVEEGTTGAE